MDIITLPSEVLAHIFKYCDINVVKEVCKYFYDVVHVHFKLQALQTLFIETYFKINVSMSRWAMQHVNESQKKHLKQYVIKFGSVDVVKHFLCDCNESPTGFDVLSAANRGNYAVYQLIKSHASYSVFPSFIEMSSATYGGNVNIMNSILKEAKTANAEWAPNKTDRRRVAIFKKQDAFRLLAMTAINKNHLRALLFLFKEYRENSPEMLYDVHEFFSLKLEALEAALRNQLSVADILFIISNLQAKDKWPSRLHFMYKIIGESGRCDVAAAVLPCYPNATSMDYTFLFVAAIFKNHHVLYKWIYNNYAIYMSIEMINSVLRLIYPEQFILHEGLHWLHQQFNEN